MRILIFWLFLTQAVEAGAIGEDCFVDRLSGHFAEGRETEVDPHGRSYKVGDDFIYRMTKIPTNVELAGNLNDRDWDCLHFSTEPGNTDVSFKKFAFKFEIKNGNLYSHDGGVTYVKDSHYVFKKVSEVWEDEQGLVYQTPSYTSRMLEGSLYGVRGQELYGIRMRRDANILVVERANYFNPKDQKSLWHIPESDLKYYKKSPYRENFLVSGYSICRAHDPCLEFGCSLQASLPLCPLEKDPRGLLRLKSGEGESCSTLYLERWEKRQCRLNF